MFNVSNANNYFDISFKSPDGATWSKKVEVKEFKQTVVRVKHVKANAEKPAEPGHASAANARARSSERGSPASGRTRGSRGVAQRIRDRGVYEP